MASQPVITFRDNTTPANPVTSVTYVQTKDGGTNLPVNQGENSDVINFRVYNNWSLASTIATALNFHITTYDGATAASHTSLKPPINQQWTHFQEIGYGEGSTQPGTLTSYTGTDTPVGGSVARYAPEKGSDGVLGQSRIRAGTNTNGLGFLALATYVSVPINASNTTYSFVITAEYEWTS